jgi:hypothetical protein
VYRILVAVRGLDKFLRSYVKVKEIKKGIYLEIPRWEKGDMVTVMYDLLKPKTCRIADIREYIDDAPVNQQRR